VLPAGLNASIDKLEAQATYCGWRRHLLVFKSADMERDFLQFFAGRSVILVQTHAAWMEHLRSLMNVTVSCCSCVIFLVAA
jgi:hypothetical protein